MYSPYGIFLSSGHGIGFGTEYFSEEFLVDLIAEHSIDFVTTSVPLSDIYIIISNLQAMNTSLSDHLRIQVLMQISIRTKQIHKIP